MALGCMFSGGFGSSDGVDEEGHLTRVGGPVCDLVADLPAFSAVFGGLEDVDYHAQVALEGSALAGEVASPGEEWHRGDDGDGGFGCARGGCAAVV